jgi:hypothetical protein
MQTALVSTNVARSVFASYVEAFQRDPKEAVTTAHRALGPVFTDRFQACVSGKNPLPRRTAFKSGLLAALPGAIVVAEVPKPKKNYRRRLVTPLRNS